MSEGGLSRDWKIRVGLLERPERVEREAAPRAIANPVTYTASVKFSQSLDVEHEIVFILPRSPH